jgi:Tol biopolymer transport system component
MDLFNTELFDGHAQIARIRPDGSGLEQWTFDEFVNWFPHISPDGRWATYISFPPGTAGHPPNVWIDVKIVALDAWSSATTVAHLLGGQGTLNTNSWAPDSSTFAYVSYPSVSD